MPILSRFQMYYFFQKILSGDLSITVISKRIASFVYSKLALFMTRNVTYSAAAIVMTCTNSISFHDFELNRKLNKLRNVIKYSTTCEKRL